MRMERHFEEGRTMDANDGKVVVWFTLEAMFARDFKEQWQAALDRGWEPRIRLGMTRGELSACMRGDGAAPTPA